MPPDGPQEESSASRGDDRGDSGGAEESASDIRGRLKRRRLVDPRTSRLLGWWDATTSIALLYTALITPPEVALLDSARFGYEPMFVINRVIDVIFIADMILQFRLMVETSSVASSGTIWLTSPKAIAINYLKGWFTLDLVSILVSAFDYLGLGRDDFGTSNDDAALSNLKVLRTLRVLRLAKLARLIRMSRVVKRWETRLTINYACALRAVSIP